MPQHALILIPASVLSQNLPSAGLPAPMGTPEVIDLWPPANYDGHPGPCAIAAIATLLAKPFSDRAHVLWSMQSLH